jgi:hypothetical protein
MQSQPDAVLAKVFEFYATDVLAPGCVYGDVTSEETLSDGMARHK